MSWSEDDLRDHSVPASPFLQNDSGEVVVPYDFESLLCLKKIGPSVYGVCVPKYELCCTLNVGICLHFYWESKMKLLLLVTK